MPGCSSIVGAEDLAAPSAEVYLLGVLGVDRKAKCGAVYGMTVIKAFPSVTQVDTAQDTALVAAEVTTNAGINGLGLIGVYLHATRVKDGGEAFKGKVLPVVTAIFAAPYTLAVGNEHAP